MTALKLFENEIFCCKEQWRAKEEEYENLNIKKNTEMNDLNEIITGLKNSLTFQQNKHKYELEISLIQQQSYYNQTLSTQDAKFKNQFMHQNMQLKNLSLEIENERNVYETKISYLNITIEKLNTEIKRLLEDIDKFKRNEEYSRANSRNALEATRSFNRRQTEQLEFDLRNSYIDHYSQLQSEKNEKGDRDIFLHEFKQKEKEAKLNVEED